MDIAHAETGELLGGIAEHLVKYALLEQEFLGLGIGQRDAVAGIVENRLETRLRLRQRLRRAACAR